MTTRRIVLIACCGDKAEFARPAADLYRSPLFAKSLRYARALPGEKEIYILSALYGLVGERDVIEPYDVTLASMTAAERSDWGILVLGQMRERGLPIDAATTELRILAGEHYRRPFERIRKHREGIYVAGPVPCFTIVDPLAGLGIGERMSFLAIEAERLEESKSEIRGSERMEEIEKILAGELAKVQL